LDTNDRQDLYVVDRELNGADMVISGALDFDVLGPRRLLVKTRDGDSLRFWEVDIAKNTKSEVVWK
jgi:hypothetical protein